MCILSQLKNYLTMTFSFKHLKSDGRHAMHPLQTWKGSSDSLAHVNCTLSSSKMAWCMSWVAFVAPVLSKPGVSGWASHGLPLALSRPGPDAHLLSICGALRSLICVTFRRRVPCWISANSALRPLGSAFLKLEASVLTCKGLRGIWL